MRWRGCRGHDMVVVEKGAYEEATVVMMGLVKDGEKGGAVVLMVEVGD